MPVFKLELSLEEAITAIREHVKRVYPDLTRDKMIDVSGVGTAIVVSIKDQPNRTYGGKD